MELVLLLIAIAAVVAVGVLGVRRMRTDTRGFDRHLPDERTGISDAEWDDAIR